MVQRNLLVYKHTWMVIVSGFFEPLFYLLGIGIGLGSMVPPTNGVSYSAFVAPGLLASSCLNGAITDGFFNIFFKLHYQKTYDGILATPMRVPDVALGEMMWALGRGSLYAAAFLVVLAGARRVDRPPDAAVVVCMAGVAGRRAGGRIVLGDGAVSDDVRSKNSGFRHGGGAPGDADVSLQRHLRPDRAVPGAWCSGSCASRRCITRSVFCDSSRPAPSNSAIAGHLAYLVDRRRRRLYCGDVPARARADQMKYR